MISDVGFPRNSFWKCPSGVLDATMAFLCGSDKKTRDKTKEKLDINFYQQNYPIFWEEFKDYYHKDEKEPVFNVFDIKFPEPPKNEEENTNYFLDEPIDPDEEETGFQIIPELYEPRDLWQGFLIEDPLEIEDFSEYINDLTLENNIRIMNDDPTAGFMIDLYDQVEDNFDEFFAQTNEDDDDHHFQEKRPDNKDSRDNQTRGRGRGRGGLRGNRGRGRGRGRGG